MKRKMPLYITLIGLSDGQDCTLSGVSGQMWWPSGGGAHGEGADKAEIWNVDSKLILELHMHLRYVQAKGAKM